MSGQARAVRFDNRRSAGRLKKRVPLPEIDFSDALQL